MENTSYETGLLALESLISRLNSSPRLSNEEKTRKYREYFAGMFRSMAQQGVSYGEATGSPGTAPFSANQAEFRANVKKIDNDLNEQIRIVTEGVEQPDVRLA